MADKLKKEYQHSAIKTSIISLVANFLLTAFKLVAGLVAHSSSMISDAIHSASDVISTIIIMIGIKIAGKEEDNEHPYGHERLECIASILLAVILALIGLKIGYDGVIGLINKSYETAEIPGTLALVAAVVSIVVKEAMYHYTIHVAKRIESSALKADAWHHRSDALSSIGALIGIGASKLGFAPGDAIASIVICGFIIKAAVEIFIEAVNGMVDKSLSTNDIKAFEETVLSVEGVKKIDSLKTRAFGSRQYIDIEIAVDGDMSLREAHDIAEEVHDRLETNFPKVKHVMVHENPYS